MINVEVKYLGKPVMCDKETGDVLRHISNYKIDELEKTDYFDDSNKSIYSYPQTFIRKEVTEIFKRYKGIYSIRFYINGVNEE